MSRRYWTPVAVALFVVACGHGGPFDIVSSAQGPSSAGPDVRLTFNVNQDYWPIWTEDGHGILYSFIRPDTGTEHRCISLLPAAGGTELWQLCDDRATQADTVSSFPAYALGDDGRLLYVEAVAPHGVQSTTPSSTTLWLADSAAPFQRRSLLTLPLIAAGTPIAWLADIVWTGPTTFVALAQDFTAINHCMYCGPLDSIFYGEAVVVGTITATGATLAPIAGTSGATGYSLAESGASIVFTLRSDQRLFKVAVGGGTATPVATVISSSTAQLLGVSCKGSICVVADDQVTLTTVLPGAVIFPSVGVNSGEIRAVSLAAGTVQLLRTTAGIAATPQISPLTGDVVAQVGGSFGHLQTFTTSASDLHLFLGLVQ